MEAVVEALNTLHYILVLKTKYASFSGRNIGYEVYKGIMGEEVFKQKIEEFEKVQYFEENPRLSGFWIPRYGFRFPGTGFWILCSKFAGFRILQANFHLHRAKEPWSNFSSNLKPYIKAWKVVIAYRKAEKKIKKLMLLPKFPLFDIKVNLKLYFMFLTIMTNIGSEKWLEVSFKEMFAIMAKILRVLINYS